MNIQRRHPFCCSFATFFCSPVFPLPSCFAPWQPSFTPSFTNIFSVLSFLLPHNTQIHVVQPLCILFPELGIASLFFCQIMFLPYLKSLLKIHLRQTFLDAFFPQGEFSNRSSDFISTLTWCKLLYSLTFVVYSPLGCKLLEAASVFIFPLGHPALLHIVETQEFS